MSLSTESGGSPVVLIIIVTLITVTAVAFAVASIKIKKAKQAANEAPVIVEEEIVEVAPKQTKSPQDKYKEMLARKTIGVNKKPKKTPKKQKGMFVVARDTDYYESKMSKEIKKFKSDDDRK